jgi:signal transduction histidine kinase
MEQGMEQLEGAIGATGQCGEMEAVMVSLMSKPGSGETLVDVAHDARNMVAALSLYCDLLEEPGVLARPFAHYGSELRLVTAASRRLVERLMVLHAQPAQERPRISGNCAPNRCAAQDGAIARRQEETGQDSTLAVPVANLAEELLANRNLLAALAGPSVTVTVEADGGAKPVRMTGEDLTRVLVNLVKNAAEAMRGGGRIRIAVSERPGRAGNPPRLMVVVQDNGPGIPPNMLERVFERGYTTRTSKTAPEDRWPAAHRGLGLAISRSIVEAAGGRLTAVRSGGGPGARLEMELPVHGSGAFTDTHGIAGFVVS